MKVSNNALNFLLAQYRAIFKRAYVKGLASAVMLTAALAAGQAQATDITDDALGLLTSAGEVTVDGDDTALTISGTASTGTTVDWKANVTVTSGAVATPTNYIQASGGNVTISGTGSLTINVGENDATTQGLAIKGGTGSAAYTTSVNLGKIDVVKGTLSIADGASGSTTVAAGSITIGAAQTTGDDAGVDTQATDATQAYVNITSEAEDVTFGAADSTITVNQGGQLSLSGDTGAIKVLGETLALNNGAILLIDGTTSSIESTKLDIAAGAVGVVKGGATGEFAGSTATVAGNLLVNGTLNINTTPATGTVTLADGSNTVISGTMTVNSGTLAVESGADLNAAQGSSTAKIEIKNNAGSNPVSLKIDSTTLKSFLDGGDKYAAIEETGALGAANGATGAQGQITLSGSAATSTAVLELTDTEQVDLAEFKFSGGASAGMIYTQSNATIKGNNILISEQLSNGTTGLAGSSSNINIVAESLTLGNGGAAESDYGFSGATVRNLYGNTTNSIALGSAITLDVTLGDDAADIADENGVIEGNFTLGTSNTLTAEHGTFTYNEGTLTLSGGSLKVTNGALTGEQGNIDTVLTLNNTLDLMQRSTTLIPQALA